MLTHDLFAAALRAGYWFCEREERVITAPVREPEAYGPATCPHCGHPAAVWHPPVLAERLKAEG